MARLTGSRSTTKQITNTLVLRSVPSMSLLASESTEALGRALQPRRRVASERLEVGRQPRRAPTLVEIHDRESGLRAGATKVTPKVFDA